MHSFVDYNQGKIYFQDEGHGPTIILLHGFLENMNMWKGFTKYLSQNFRVITPDLPGHGKSSTYGAHSSMEFMAGAVHEVIKMLGVEKAVIIGHSMGGYVAQTFVELFPEIAVGFGYFHSHAAADSPESKINRGRAIKVVEENHQSFISNFIPDLFTEENREKYFAEIEIMQTEASQMNKDGIIGALYAMRERKDGYKLLKNTVLPVLFIIGKQDIRAPMEELKKQIFIAQKSQILILDKVAHMGFLEDSKSCLTFIEGFVKGCY